MIDVAMEAESRTLEHNGLRRRLDRFPCGMQLRVRHLEIHARWSVLLNPSKPTTPLISNTNDPMAKRWHEIRALVTRGVNEPENLTPDEVRRVSSVALIGLRETGLDWGDDACSPAPKSETE